MTAKSLSVQKKPATGYRLSLGSGKRREIESRTNKKNHKKEEEEEEEGKNGTKKCRKSRVYICNQTSYRI